jgi:single-stranded DNA-binding protein
MSIECAMFGTLGRDCEPKVSKNGRGYLKLNVRVGDGDSVTWVNVMAFIDGADELAPKLVKNAAVYVEGSIRLDEWVGQDGTEKHGLSVMARRLELSAIGKNRPQRKNKPTPDRVGKSDSTNTFYNDEIGF